MREPRPTSTNSTVPGAHRTHRGTVCAAAVAAALGLALAAPAAPAFAAPSASAATNAPGRHHNGNLTAADLTVTRGDDGSYSISWPAGALPGATVYASTDPDDPSHSGRLVARVGNPHTTSVTVNGLDTAHRWYFEVVPAGQHGHGVVTAEHRVILDGTVNTRDLGGITTADGHSVRWGRVLRSDALNKLTPGDQALLAAMGLRTDVDFRGDSEITADGADRVPTGATFVHAPPMGDSDLASVITQALADGDNATLQQLLGDGKAFQMNVDGARDMALSPTARAVWADTLRQLADPGQTPLLYHCTAGKDRTGMMTALLLRVLGVPQQTVMNDYLASNDYRRASNEATYAYLRSKGVDPELVRPLMEQSPEYLQAFFDGIHDTYGSLDAYLHDGLGLDRATVDRLRSTLLTR